MLAVGVEIVWLIFIAAFAAGSAYPIYDIIAPDFVVTVIVLAMLFAFYFRLVVFFRQVAWLQWFPIQIILFVLNPVLFIMALSKMQDMAYSFDSYDMLHFIVLGSDVNTYEMNEAFQLFRKEFLLFAVGLLILLLLTELRILMAFVKRVREME